MSMKPGILETLDRIYGQATRMPLGSGTAPDAILSATEGAWQSGDVRRLAKLARIAAAMGDMADEVARATERLAMKARQGRFVDFEEADLWAIALRWAIDDLASNTWFGPAPGSTSRAHEVGAAAVRLREAGYPVAIGADGCRIAEGRRRELLSGSMGLSVNWVASRSSCNSSAFWMSRDVSRTACGCSGTSFRRWASGRIPRSLMAGFLP
jgi:hypothetical protein